MTRLPTVKAGFKGPIYSDPSPSDGKNFYRLTKALTYHSRITGRIVSVPNNFPTDFASFRIGDLELRGKTDRPAVVHDWLYASGVHRKWLADLIFYEACRTEGMGRIRAGLRCAAVLIAPTARKAWKAHRKGNTPGARFVRALIGGPDFTSTTNQP